ncbi:MAG: MBL fold metallo-hydrolase [Gammaproteobacteria bacterium]|nr:MBL fold metallo-hydrolase [Gammaproteobacteria bacterium]
MKAVIIPVTQFQQNCSLIWCDDTGRGAVIDPGGDLDRVLAEVERRGVEVEKILLTHGHVDHAAGTTTLKATLGCRWKGPTSRSGSGWTACPTTASSGGFDEASAFEPDRWLDDGDTVSVGNIVLDVYHCPGHTPGHVVFFEPRTRIAFVGDVLFKGSIGRTDFPRGDHEQLLGSIRGRLWPLGDDVTFVPGHGPVSTFGDERRTNPFVGEGAR